MRKSSKKSTVKSKSKKRKNPLKKYQTGSMVTPTVGATGPAPGTFGSGTLGSGGLDSGFNLGSDSYISSPTSTTNTYNSQFGDSFSSPYGSDFSSTPNSSYSGLDAGLNTDPIKPRTLTEFNVDENTKMSQAERNQANVMNTEYKADPRGPSKKERDLAIAESAMAATTPGLGFITEATKKKTIDDPNRYYSREVKKKLESYNRKISAAKSASSVGQGIMASGAVLGSTGVGAIPGAIVTAVGGIVTGVSEGFASGYRGSQKEVGAAYDLAVANRKRTERRAEAQKEKNEEMNQQQYFQLGGLKKEAPLEEEVDVMDPAMDVLMNGGIRKYMGGGYTKVNGPSHENGGVAMDLDGDGAVDSELEGGEIIEEMKHGGNASKKYIWSDHLKTGGMSFAKKFEQERKRGATPRRIEKLRVEQELAAKRDPSKLYKKYGGMHKYQTGGQRVSRTGAGKFIAEYGAPIANLAGEFTNIGMNLSQEYNPVETVSAPDVKAEKVFIDRAKDLRVGARESELINAKRSLQMSTGPKNAALNSARMVSLRAQEEAAQNVYDQNRQASSTEQQLNQAAQLKAAMTNQANARLESESRRNEGLRKESFENMRKKYIGSAASGLGNQLAQGMYTKEYINATLPEGVDPYAIKPNAIPNKMKEINPATGKKYTNAEATNAVLIQYRLENP